MPLPPVKGAAATARRGLEVGSPPPAGFPNANLPMVPTKPPRLPVTAGAPAGTRPPDGRTP
jgi:hypothetical protein